MRYFVLILHSRVRGWHWVFSSVALYLSFWVTVSLGLELADWLDWLAAEHERPSCDHLSCWNYSCVPPHPPFSVDSGNPDSSSWLHSKQFTRWSVGIIFEKIKCLLSFKNLNCQAGEKAQWLRGPTALPETRSVCYSSSRGPETPNKTPMYIQQKQTN